MVQATTWIAGSANPVTTTYVLYNINGTPFDTTDDTAVTSSGALFADEIQADYSGDYGTPGHAGLTDCSANPYHNAWYPLATGLAVGTYRLNVTTSVRQQLHQRREHVGAWVTTRRELPGLRRRQDGRLQQPDGGTQLFYLAQIDAVHAGKTMEIKLFDPGDVNFAAAQIMSGQHELTIGGGVELMSRVGIGASGGAWPVDPSVAVPAYFMPQGVSADLIATKYGFSRDDVDAYAVREPEARGARPGSEGRFEKSVVPVKDINGLTILDQGRAYAADTRRCSRWRRCSRPSRRCGQMGGFDAVAIQSHPEIESIELRAPCRQFVRHRRRRGRGAARQQAGGQEARPEAARERSAPSPISARSRR